MGEELTLDVYAYDIVDLEYLAVGKAKQIPAAIAGGGGTVEGSKNAVMLPCGTEITVTAVADEGYQFAGWKKVTSDAVTEQAGDEALKITPVIGEQYMALFKIIPHFGNITVKNGGKVSVGQPAP